MSQHNQPFAPRGTAHEIETGAAFQPKFDGAGLIAAIIVDAVSGEVVMFAWMNELALAESLKTGVAHFWSRSRQKLWRKGEESGNTLEISEIRTDCDQDSLVLKVRVRGDGVACHTGAKSCFYRMLDRVPETGAVMLRRTDD
jgi:phosphoribosyl-AMP cyclohydrolase